MRTFLVAIVAPNQQDVMDLLTSGDKWNDPDQRAVDSWWIAEDDREDGSDNDSAVFVPRGAQADVASLINDWVEHHTEEWDEHGYPYAETDVSGAFYLPYETRQRIAREDRERAAAIQPGEYAVVKADHFAPFAGAPAGQFVRLNAGDRVTVEYYEVHSQRYVAASPVGPRVWIDPADVTREG